MHRKSVPYALGVAALALATACGEQEPRTPETPPPGGATPTVEGPSTPTVTPPAGGGPAVNTANLPPGVTAQMVQEGKQIFEGPGLCYTCHGQNAMGTALAPNLTDNQWIDSDGSFESIVTLVTNGVPQPKQYPAPMPPKGGSSITDDQVRAVSAYVYAISHPGG